MIGKILLQFIFLFIIVFYINPYSSLIIFKKRYSVKQAYRIKVREKSWQINALFYITMTNQFEKRNNAAIDPKRESTK